MLFSEHFKIKRMPDDRWFDPILSLDTPLFLDPFLIYANEQGEFAGSHDEIIRFFNSMFRLVAAAAGDESSPSYPKALFDLKFPEVEDLCLGYTATGTRGAGSGRHIARDIVGALEEAIRAGLVRLSHFEEIGILREGIGPDRISDITAALLRRRFVKYTQEVCLRHPGIPTQDVRYMRGYYDFESERWAVLPACLPMNPYNGKPILLAPAAYLRELPTINTDGFWDYCKSFESEMLRNDFSRDITKRVAKGDIIAVARKNPRLVEQYAKSLEHSPPPPYDLEDDQKGLVSWIQPTQKYCTEHPLDWEVRDAGELVRFLEAAVDEFRNFVELDDGWRCLWNRRGERKDERAAQLLLLGIVKHYCQAKGVKIQPEQNVGRGAAAFTSATAAARVLVELKFARNRRFWNAVAAEKPEHKKAEGCARGFIVIVEFDEKDVLRGRDGVNLVAELKPEYRIKTVRVDGGHDDAEAWESPATAQVHNGDVIIVNAPVNDSAVGSGARIDASAPSAEKTPKNITVVQFIAGDRGGGPRSQVMAPREQKAISDAVGLGQHWDAFRFAPPLYAASIDDVIACRQEKPGIIHFVGHGEERRMVLVRDRDLLVEMMLLQPEHVETLFKNFPARIRLVVFNTCHSLELARHLTEKGVVDLAIGIEGTIADDYAIRFATTLYGQLAEGLSVKCAFDLAGLHVGGVNETSRPQLLQAPGVDAEQVFFAPSA